MQKINVLTLWQPWATLYAFGLKGIETRPSKTSFKGTYLIHAAKKMDKFQKEICEQEPFKSALEWCGIYDWRELPTGSIIGSVQNIKCYPIKFDLKTNLFFLDELFFHKDIKWPEYNFGDYKVGRFAWIGTNHKILKEPLPYKGGQGYYQTFKGDSKSLIFK